MLITNSRLDKLRSSQVSFKMRGILRKSLLSNFLVDRGNKESATNVADEHDNDEDSVADSSAGLVSVVGANGIESMRSQLLFDLFSIPTGLGRGEVSESGFENGGGVELEL